jgi:hypothetical protein
MRKIVLGIVLALALAPQAPAQADETYVIDSGVWGFYQKYLRAINNGQKPGAFVITKDGMSAYYNWCQDTRCRVLGSSYSQSAINDCERDTGTECVVFAIRDDIRVEYEIAGATDPG